VAVALRAAISFRGMIRRMGLLGSRGMVGFARRGRALRLRTSILCLRMRGVLGEGKGVVLWWVEEGVATSPPGKI
jgi:hypothetical protein